MAELIKSDWSWNSLWPGEHLGTDGGKWKAWGRDIHGLYAREIKPNPEMIAEAKAKREEYQIHSTKPNQEYIVATQEKFVTPRLSREEKKAIKEAKKAEREKVRWAKAKARSRKLSKLKEKYPGLAEAINEGTDLRKYGSGGARKGAGHKPGRRSLTGVLDP